MVFNVIRKVELEENKMTFPFLVSWCGTDEDYKNHLVIFAVDRSEASKMFEMLSFRDSIDFYNFYVEPIVIFGPYFKVLEGYARVRKENLESDSQDS